jgi:hypothetical protein
MEGVTEEEREGEEVDSSRGRSAKLVAILVKRRWVREAAPGGRSWVAKPETWR